MTDKTAEQAAREWLREHYDFRNVKVMSHEVDSLTALLEFHASERERAAIEQQWRPIETAPKDGTEVWAYNGEQVGMKWIEGDEYGLWIYADELLADVEPNPDQPTHWMPVPTPPKDQSTRQAKEDA